MAARTDERARIAVGGRIDIVDGKRDVEADLRRSTTKRKATGYPDETNGTRWAAQGRKSASKLTAEEEADYFRKAMARVYGGSTKQTTGTRH